MPLIANLNGKRINAEDTNDRKQKYLCPMCKKQMMLVKPISNIVDHFRHYNLCPHITEPETIEHLNGKKYLFNFFKKYNPILEKKLPNGQIADVYLDGDKKIAIEYQCSNISLNAFEKRNRGYKDMGLSVLWVFGTKRYYHCNYEHGYISSARLSLIERTFLDIGDGRSICYLSNGNKAEFKRIFFDSYWGLVTKFDIEKEYLLNEFKKFNSYDSDYIILLDTDEITKDLKNKVLETRQDALPLYQKLTWHSKFKPYKPPKMDFATEKQINYLKKLGHSNPDGLSKKEASEFISFFKREKQEQGMFFTTQGDETEVCPVCKTSHHNANTSFCSEDCFKLQIWRLRNKE